MLIGIDIRKPNYTKMRKKMLTFYILDALRLSLFKLQPKLIRPESYYRECDKCSTFSKSFFQISKFYLGHNFLMSTK